MMLSPYTKVFADVYAHLDQSFKGWNCLFAEEKVELTINFIASMEQAYDEAFSNCEEQDSGFSGSTSWTNNNPYRKDENVLGIIANIQRNLSERYR